MSKTIFRLIVIFSVTLLFTLTVYSQPDVKTVTLPSGEVVCNLNGEWNAQYEHYGPLEWVGNIKGVLVIVQEGNTFVGKTTKDTQWSAKGTDKIRGEIDKQGLKKAQYSVPTMGWQDTKCEMNKDCNKIILDTGIGVKAILERR